VLARALGRARWTIFWERLWPALASVATVVGLFLAVSWFGLWLWLPPIGRGDRSRCLLSARRRGVRPVPDAAHPEPDGRSPAARPQLRPAPSAGHRDRRRDRRSDRRFVFHRAVACPCGARVARGQDAQGRDPDATAGAARSLRRARPRGGAGGCDVLCRGRGTHEARRCSL
jgi:hypothetical protein